MLIESLADKKKHGLYQRIILFQMKINHED